MPVEAEALSAGIARLSKLSSSNPSIEDLLGEVIGAVHGLFRLTGAGFMMIDDRNALRSVASSDHAGELLETSQRDSGEGPCIDAFVHDVTTFTTDLGSDERYTRVGPWLSERGVRAVLGVPIRLGGGPVGSLNVYVDQPHEWLPEEIEGLETYGQLLSGFLSTALAAHQRGEVVDQLQYALNYRIVIERAVGFLMGRHRIGEVDAFNQLRRAARDRQRRVADVAREVVQQDLAL